jgi:hypothetical protein
LIRSSRASIALSIEGPYSLMYVFKVSTPCAEE